MDRQSLDIALTVRTLADRVEAFAIQKPQTRFEDTEDTCNSDIKRHLRGKKNSGSFCFAKFVHRPVDPPTSFWAFLDPFR